MDGVLGGVGGMLVFVPVIVLLYLVLGVLEDSGYLARAAYITDRAMAPIGLPGNSVLPLVVGFGCNVPALLATRVIARPNDRLLTALLVPFVSCAAHLPVYVLLAGALFPGQEGAVVFALYLTSIAAVFLVGLLLRHTLMRGPNAPRSCWNCPHTGGIGADGVVPNPAAVRLVRPQGRLGHPARSDRGVGVAGGAGARRAG